MGSWGLKPFDNDTANDWLFELDRSSDLKVLRAALTPPPGHMPTTDCEVLLGAAQTLTAALGRADELPTRARTWLSRHPHLDYPSLLPLARTHLTRLLTLSEMSERYQDSGQHKEWLEVVADLVDRLG